MIGRFFGAARGPDRQLLQAHPHMNNEVEHAPAVTERRCEQLHLVQRAHGCLELAHLVAEDVDRFQVWEGQVPHDRQTWPA